ncbi:MULTISPECIES: ribosomal protein L7/L12 [unclassified Streptomyces]|uniref:ribosomal protein L7/L12 n=1 Tax=unclassified Streptomyces TaxID=2593676 RepID=UPI00381637EC
MESLLPAIAVLLFVVLLLSGFADTRAKRTERRLQRIERKLDQLMAHVGAAVPEEPRMAEVDELLRGDKKIQAIKVYREITGADLVEAKEAVERRMR